MTNKETLQGYNTRLDTNNSKLLNILQTINELPEAGSGEGTVIDKQYVDAFVPGTINGASPPTYINSVNDNRAQYIGFNLKIIPGKEYKFVGASSSCNYAVMQIGQETIDAVTNGESFDSSTFALANTGWSSNEFTFIAVEGATNVWISAKKTSGADFSTSDFNNLLPCYIEVEVEPEIVIIDAKVYSTEEQVVGKWVDNKPLYRKSFIQPFTVASGAVTISAITHGITDIENIWVGNESCYIDSSGNSYATNYCDVVSSSTGKRIRTVPNSQKIAISITSGIFADGAGNAYITVYYTKSTDSASDDDLGTVNYSLDEQEVGTDVEGNIIYEKVISSQPSYSVNGGNKTTNISINVDNAQNISIVDGFWYGRGTSLNSNRDFYPLNFINSLGSLNRQFSKAAIISKAIRFVAGDWITVGSSLQLYAKIRYTKAI